MYELKVGLLNPMPARISMGRRLTKDQTSPRLRPIRRQSYLFDGIQFCLEIPVGAVLYRDDQGSFFRGLRRKAAPTSC
jgi:hypothetical protein